MEGKATAVAHPIEGLVKYHGMRDDELRLPYHDSISLCTKPTRSVTTVAFEPTRDADEYVVDGEQVTDGAADRIRTVIDRVRTLAGIDTRVRLVTFGAEEIGLWGAYHEAETTPHGAIKCVVNLDGACNSRSLRVGHNGFEAMAEVFEAATDALDAPLSTRDTISPHGDQWAFVQEGIPAVMASTESEQSGRGWGHTHADTLDKLDPRDLRDVATLVAEAVARFADADVETPHRDRTEIRDAIDDGYVQELKTGGRWPYDE